jgi:L-lactate dehydrogenase complex protein LldG
MNSRERILARLYASGTQETTVPEVPAPREIDLNREGRTALLAEKMAAMRTEVHVVAADRWLDKLQELARQRGWKQLLYGPSSPIGEQIGKGWASAGEGLPELVAYSEPVESFRDALFHIDAGITGTRGAVADTGAVVLWPTPDEPRLLSVVPPVHVAVVDADKIHNSLGEMMAAEDWAAAMPTNALLISGPSKTADIEFILVFGVHGPKELVLLIRT